ncbi:N-acetylglucosamine-6-phosphate deacetylase [Gelidibacter salicanalis]|uniref:Amidohydrolase family protein n=1 Tax=Gelidibacter salicanalis TaxID=291193 RepID=A0A934KWL3_9FLAO|nr:amidohydrolase family protein [Gelidibacter salicanalis]MBJ7881663.1 amidohydrolase family protein [Gelidibacter salicanalis]
MILKALDYRTGKPIRVEVNEDCIHDISGCIAFEDTHYYIAPGLVDLQINGFKGIDFNKVGLEVADVYKLTQTLFGKGITTFFPTIITNSDEATVSLIKVISLACESNTEVNDCIGGIHLEGPFLSLEDGPRGAHPKQYIKKPNWELFEKWQKAAGGRIRIITLSPEWPEATDFIKRCTDTGVIVSIGHTAASPHQINQAIEAGATMSTHLGNASHAMLPRHVNYLWEQLASDALWSTLIADGFHLPDALLKIFLRTKPNKSILVSDATSYADLPNGSYTGHIGGDVVLDHSGKLYMKDSPTVLAGSAQSLLWCVNQLVAKHILPLSEAWNMASIKPTVALFGKVHNDLEVGRRADLVIFKNENNNLRIVKTIKSGKLVYSALD